MPVSDNVKLPFEDPLKLIPKVFTKLYTIWLSLIYPFASRGEGLSIHYTCRMSRTMAPFIRIGRSVWVGKDTWLNAIDLRAGELRLILDDGVRIGTRCQLSAKNRIHLQRNVVLSSSVLIMDHNHAYEDPNVPIRDQGETAGGTIEIGEGTFIGQGAVILCDKSELIIGKNCVIGSNSVLSRSIPAYSVVLGNPGRIVRHLDPEKQAWVWGSARPSALEAKDSPVLG